MDRQKANARKGDFELERYGDLELVDDPLTEDEVIGVNELAIAIAIIMPKFAYEKLWLKEALIN
uniref:Uncharacterized protein n=1 Tax=Tetranychus urticae TaxID=32264 RepID=T1K683_TETUR